MDFLKSSSQQSKTLVQRIQRMSSNSIQEVVQPEEKSIVLQLISRAYEDKFRGTQFSISGIELKLAKYFLRKSSAQQRQCKYFDYLFIVNAVKHWSLNNMSRAYATRGMETRKSELSDYINVYNPKEGPQNCEFLGFVSDDSKVNKVSCHGSYF